MDKAWVGRIDIAINKAWTSRAYDISTKELAELSQSATSSLDPCLQSGAGHDLRGWHSAQAP